MKNLIPNFLYKFLQKSRRLLVIILYKLFCLIKINTKKIILYSPSNAYLKGNLKYIYESIDDKKIYCFFHKLNLIKFIYHIATAKIVITDDYCPILYPIKFRTETKFIQIWHASGIFKNVGFKRIGLFGGPKKNSITHKNYTDVIISSTKLVDEYSKTFMIDKNKINALGTPRTDLFFNKEKLKELKKEFSSKYPQTKNKKIILYAPTFRGNGKKTAYFDYSIIDFNKLILELKQEYIIFFKPHPFINNIKIINNENIINIDKSADINEILPYIDILITDYSSIIFDALLLNKKTIFYVPDLTNYQKNRGMYFDLEHYNFGSIVFSQELLVPTIKNMKFNEKKAKELKEKHLNKCDGYSTKRFIDFYIK